MNDERITVAYLVHSFCSGGIERCIVNLVNNLDRDQCSPLIICLSRSGESAGSVLNQTPIVEIGKRPGWDQRVIGRLADTLSSHNVSILHSHNWGTLIEGSLARRRARTPVHLHTEHGQGLHSNVRGPKKFLRRRANAWAFGRLNALASCARCVAPLVEARSGFPSEKVLYLPNGVPVPKAEGGAMGVSKLRQSLLIPSTAVVLGSTGRLVSVKGFVTAIAATARLKSMAHDVHLVLVGDGEIREDLKRHALELGIASHVHFVGYQDQVGPWLSMFDIFLNTSLSEAMSLSVLEAMAMGLPIVASDVGDNREMVLGHRPCGRVFPSQDIEALVRAISSLLDDEKLKEIYRDNSCRVYSENFSIESMVDKHQRTYLSLLDDLDGGRRSGRLRPREGTSDFTATRAMEDS